MEKKKTDNRSLVTRGNRPGMCASLAYESTMHFILFFNEGFVGVSVGRRRPRPLGFLWSHFIFDAKLR